MNNYVNRAMQFRAKRRLGQNFLVDEAVIDKILSFVKPSDSVLEIGAGLGFVTEKLIETAKEVFAVELDQDALKHLQKLDSSKLKLFHADILKTNLQNFPAQTLKVVANIPYYITSPIILHLLGEIDQLQYENRQKISEIILMVQLEVAKRLVAQASAPNKQYGSLSILAQFFADAEIVQIVPRKCFMPSPKVDSALVKFKIRPNPRVCVENYTFLRKVVKAIFASRRKNIKNSLVTAGFCANAVACALDELEIATNTRGETLDIAQIAQLSEVLYEKIKS